MSSDIHQIYALLIGIDNYRPSEVYKDLGGCVRDINHVDSYLQQSLQVPPAQIFRLSSPIEEDKALLTARSAADRKPTYQNIVEAFKEITDIAQTGDRIYLHYSGHGGRAITSYPELKEKKDSDEGLVPCDYAQTGRYLRDVEIATLLKRMTDKGLVVTFILDSCHSGGATRGDSAIRGVSTVDRKQELRESLVAPKDELISNWRALSSTEKSFSGLLPAKDYVLLAACRPTEYAFEYAINGGDRHGALTFWTIDTLNTLGHQISYQTLHNRVSAKVQSDHPSQLPMLVGDGDKTVFGSDRQSVQYTATVLNVDAQDNTVTISAGNAQGIGIGARFAAYLLNADTRDETQQQAVLEVQRTEATQSIARIVPPAEGGLPIENAAIEQGAPAKMLSAPVELVRQVKLCEQKQSGVEALNLPEAIASQQESALAAVREAMAENGWVIETHSDDQASHYQVSVGQEGAYEICAGMPIPNLSPPLMIDQPDAAKQVVKRLVHLSKYQAVQSLDNPSSKIRHLLSCRLLDDNHQPLSASNHLTVQKDKSFFLEISNKGNIPLNIAILNLEPTWAISQVEINGLAMPFYELDKGATETLPLRFSIPTAARYAQSKEIIKVFAAVSPVDFRYLLLPPLDKNIEYRGIQKMRSSNAFSKLLEAVGSDASGAPTLTRAVVSVPDPNAQWATEQFSLIVKS